MKGHEAYSGILADLYDLWASRWMDYDTAAYQRAMQELPGRVLELGCGTGRLLLPYVQSGLPVEGLDASADMLAICRAKAEQAGLTPVLYQQDMQAFSLPSTYTTVFVAAGSFGLLTNRDDVRATLQCCYQHLEPGGQLLIALSVPWDHITRSSQADWVVAGMTTRPQDGATVMCHRACRYDVVDQISTTWLKYEIYHNNVLAETHQRIGIQRWYYPHESCLLLERAGFHSITVGTIDSGIPITDFGTEMLFRARK
jgi:SAM-dependent methyltransferase